MPKRSAGLLLYRRQADVLEVLLVHPGGPFWKNKDDGAWSIPKGEIGPDEDPLDAARREFAEETGADVPANPPLELGEVRQGSGKIVIAWAVEGDLDATAIVSNEFEMEWPPRSGKLAAFPEIDRADWFGLMAAREKILKGQLTLLDRLEAALQP